MSDLKLKTHEDKDREIVSDSPGRIQEPLQSHTFSLKNNAAGLSSDEHENPLNGTQPNPFVYSSVPAVPHAGNSLPSGALVNGPGSHPTSEVHCVLNKGTVLSNNVLDAAWQAEKDTSLEVLRPPSELQSDAWKNTAGPAVKTPATQPGVNAPLSHLEENESKLAYSTLSGESAERMHLSQPQRKRTIKTTSRQGVGWSERSSRDYQDAEVIRWDSAGEDVLHGDSGLETEGRHQRSNALMENTPGCVEKVKSNLNHLNALFCTGNDDETVDAANRESSLGPQADLKHSVALFKHLSRNNVSAAHKGLHEPNGPEDEDSVGPKVEATEPPLLFSCTTCRVQFKDKRHMMHHLSRHYQLNSRRESQPFTCRECGRLFCDSYSLSKHIIIHRDRLQRRTCSSGRRAGATALQRPQYVNGCNCSKILVQHAKTHDNLKHYYFCEECNYVTLTQEALEAHFRLAHLGAQPPQPRRMTQANDAEAPFECNVDFLTGTDRLALERHPGCGDYKTPSDQIKTPGPVKPVPTFEKAASFPISCSKNRVTCVQEDRTANPPQFRCHVGCTKNTALPSLWKIDKHRKLLLQPAEKLDEATDLTCVEEDAANNGCGAFGSPKQANRAPTTGFLLSARSLKLDQMFFRASKNDPASETLRVQGKQRSPSMNKVSTPLRNTIDSVNANILPKHRKRLKKESAVRELEKGYGGSSNFSKDTSEATGSVLESIKNERNHFARGYHRERQRFAGKDQSPHALKDEDDGDEDCSDIEQLIIKEEYIEATVCEDSPDPPRTSTSDSFEVLTTRAVEHKPCPYCPAVFKSGVGLSNHVRGHLHRVGLSYNARHLVSPKQVALGDHQPRTRRGMCGATRVRKVVKPEDQREYPCPLCRLWFDTKTGLSNHVRGHLKRIGGSVTGTAKSPLGLINELLRDESKANQTILQSPFPPCLLVSQRFISSNGYFQVHAGVPVKAQFGLGNPYPVFDSFASKQEAEAISERRRLQVEAQTCPKASSSTLVELLKMRQGCVELTATSNQRRKVCDMTKEYREENKMGGYDYKRKKPRPGPGLKQRILPSLNAEIYTLTCRDLCLSKRIGSSIYRGTSCTPACPTQGQEWWRFWVFIIK
ncbi:zinc finger protein 644 isoform X2 [Betta splendens]|uniref:Zinc finger protein 644 isoform X2 n=1 Tax=Betta splendens TaxID=158456 RepID=A0A8M1HD30_BETSP|nr:zinc finger protein 644 isoform X2 [Betta splendens]